MREVGFMLESLYGVSNSLRQPPIHLHRLQTDDTSYSTYISAASSFRSSTTTTVYLEDEGNTSISEGEGNVTLTEIESADSNTELQVQGEIQGDETSAAIQQGEQINTAIVSVVTLTDIESADSNTELQQAQGESFGRMDVSTDTSKRESSQGVDPSKSRTSTDKYRSNPRGLTCQLSLRAHKKPDPLRLIRQPCIEASPRGSSVFLVPGFDAKMLI